MNDAVRHRVLSSLLLAGLLALGLLSLFLAWGRVYQVDEAQYVTMARIIAMHETASFFTSTPFYLLVLAPLSCLSDRSADLFHLFRLVTLALFWANLLLLVRATGARLRTREGLATLAFAATLPPLWTYGLEFRHDNVLLFGLLLIWILMRPSGAAVPGAYFWMGLIAVGLQLSLFKAFAYWVPLTLAALALPHPAFRRPRLLLVLQWGVGAAASFGLYHILRAAWRIEDLVLPVFSSGLAVAQTTNRFSPWPALERLPVQTPLLVIAAIVALGLAVWLFVRKGLDDDQARTSYATAALLAGSLGVLFINPTPFPYNLLLVIPPAVIAASTALRERLFALWEKGRQRSLFAALAIVQLAAFGVQAKTLLNATNGRQEELMALAERVTDPKLDTVFDLAGLVPTRPSITYIWFVNLTNFRSFQKDPALIERPAPVVIPNYRVGYLSKEQHEFLSRNYTALANDFLVLGADLPPGGGLWLCRHPGRYALGAEGSRSSFRVDGVPLEAGVYAFAAGAHRIEGDAGATPFIFWVGPPSLEPVRIGPGDLSRVFPVPGDF